MTDTPRTALEMQIEQEKKELDAVPKAPIHKFLGSHARCHLCGQLYHPEEGTSFDQHTGNPRKKCPNCGGANG